MKCTQSLIIGRQFILCCIKQVGIKLTPMSHLLSSMLCPKNQKASLVCISNTCQSAPFQCLSASCVCSTLHFKCQTMQLQAVSDYLVNWKQHIGKEGKQFMSRVEKIFENIRSRLQREFKLFTCFCKDMFLGKDYSKLMYLIEKDEKKSITGQLFSSSLKRITEPNINRSFSSFTLSQMKNIDQITSQLLSRIQTLYKSKEVKGLETMKRCSSATERNHNNNTKGTIASEKSNLQQSIMNLKLDLTFPRSINSKIVPEASLINKILTKKITKYNLAYRASECSFSITEFYRKLRVTCKQLNQNHLAKKKATNLASLILVKTQFGKVLGGYTPLEWEETKQIIDSDEDSMNPEAENKHSYFHKYKSDPTASTVMFSLDLMEKYSLNRPEQAIYCGRKSIGFGKGDLKIAEKGDEHRKSYCKLPASFNYSPKPYLSWSKSGMELSGSRYSVYFKLKQWQAFILQY